MEGYEWDGSLSLGIEEIDAQHKRLFELLERLHEGIEQNLDREVMKEVLVELVRYTTEHFGAEERYMQEYGYPEYERHRAEHVRFIKEVRTAMDDFIENRISVPLRVSKFLREWIVDHISKVDGRLAPFLRAQGL